MSSATFTFRIPDSMAGRLSSAEMRAWLTQFLRSPYSLPPDPGSGFERISLTLPRELVRDAAGYLRCSSSSALRRVAAAQLGVRRPPMAPRVTFPVGPTPTDASGMAPIAPHTSLGGHRTNQPHGNSADIAAVGETAASGGLAILISLVIMGGLILMGTTVNGVNNSA